MGIIHENQEDIDAEQEEHRLRHEQIKSVILERMELTDRPVDMILDMLCTTLVIASNRMDGVVVDPEYEDLPKHIDEAKDANEGARIGYNYVAYTVTRSAVNIADRYARDAARDQSQEVSS